MQKSGYKRVPHAANERELERADKWENDEMAIVGFPFFSPAIVPSFVSE